MQPLLSSGLTHTRWQLGLLRPLSPELQGLSPVLDHSTTQLDKHTQCPVLSSLSILGKEPIESLIQP